MSGQMQCLNEPERNFAEKHHYLVMDYLRRKRLPMGEFYDVVIFRYLRSVQLYLASERLQQYSFATVANKAMEWAVKDHWRKYYRHPQYLCSFDSSWDESYTSREPAALPDVEEAVCSTISAETLLCRLPAFQRQVVCLRMEGYSDREIAKKAGIPQMLVNNCFSHIRENMTAA